MRKRKALLEVASFFAESPASHPQNKVSDFVYDVAEDGDMRDVERLIDLFRDVALHLKLAVD